jgi:hypothetical protein
VIVDGLVGLDGVTVEHFVPVIANQVPHARVRWDRRIVRTSPGDVVRQLRDGDPPIELVPVPYVEGSLEVASWTLQPGDAEIVARRLRAVLESA